MANHVFHIKLTFSAAFPKVSATFPTAARFPMPIGAEMLPNRLHMYLSILLLTVRCWKLHEIDYTINKPSRFNQNTLYARRRPIKEWYLAFYSKLYCILHVGYAHEVAYHFKIINLKELTVCNEINWKTCKNIKNLKIINFNSKNILLISVSLFFKTNYSNFHTAHAHKVTYFLKILNLK